MNVCFVFGQSLEKRWNIQHWPRLQAAPPSTLGNLGCLTPRAGELALWQGGDKDDRTAQLDKAAASESQKLADVSCLKERKDGILVLPNVGYLWMQPHDRKLQLCVRRRVRLEQ